MTTSCVWSWLPSPDGPVPGAVCHGVPLPVGMRICWVLLGVIVVLVVLPLVLLVACIWLFGLAALLLV